MTTLNSIVRTVILATAFAGVLPATASAQEVAPSVEINVAGTDFTSPAAVRSLRHRVIYAARSVCDHGEAAHGMLSYAERACITAAISKANAEIDSRQALAQTQRAAQVARANPGDDTTKRDH